MRTLYKVKIFCAKEGGDFACLVTGMCTKTIAKKIINLRPEMQTGSLALYHKISKAALVLPEVYEKIMYGTPAFYIDKKFFVRLKQDGETLALYNDGRDEWIARNGDVFFFTDHYKNYPMLLVDLKRISGEDLNILLKESWKIRASKKLLKIYGDL